MELPDFSALKLRVTVNEERALPSPMFAVITPEAEDGRVAPEPPVYWSTLESYFISAVPFPRLLPDMVNVTLTVSPTL